MIPYWVKVQYQVTIIDNQSLAKEEVKVFNNMFNYFNNGSDSNVFVRTILI